MKLIGRDLLYLSLISTCALAQSDSQSLFEKIRPAVVTVISYNEAGEVIRKGIGLVVSKDGDMITHKQLIEGVSRAEVATSDGKTHPVIKLVSHDSQSDMVLFSVDMPTAAPAIVGNGVPERKETVAAVALNERGEHQLIEGNVSDIKHYRLWANISVAASLPLESLGNPVFNLKGEFIGIVTFQSQGEQSFTAAVGKRLPNMLEDMLKAKRSDSGKISKNGNKPLSTEGIQRVGGILQGKAIKRVAPSYPKRAKEYGISGTVIIEVLVDEKGRVIRAEALPGNFQIPRNVTEEEARAIAPLLKKAGEDAARKWKFKPTTLDGVPVKVIGTITFNFRM